MELLRIKDLLRERGVTSKDLAERLEVTPATVSNINNGNHFPKPELLKKIAEVLNVDIRELFYSTKDSDLNGFVEYKGEVFRIKNPEDLTRLNEAVNKLKTTG